MPPPRIQRGADPNPRHSGILGAPRRHDGRPGPCGGDPKPIVNKTDLTPLYDPEIRMFQLRENPRVMVLSVEITVCRETNSLTLILYLA